MGTKRAEHMPPHHYLTLVHCTPVALPPTSFSFDPIGPCLMYLHWVIRAVLWQLYVHVGEVEMDPVPFGNFYIPRFLYVIGVCLRIVRRQDLPIHGRLSIYPCQKGKQHNAPGKKGIWRGGWHRYSRLVQSSSIRHREDNSTWRRIFGWNRAKRHR